MNENELRDALHAGVPITPETSGWADAARRRSRRTRGIVAGGAVLAVTLVAAMAVANLGPGAIVAVPAAPASSAPASGTPGTTPGDAGDGCAGYSAATAGDIPTEALALRLCPTGESVLQQFTPLEALEAPAAKQVLAEVLRSRRPGENFACTADLGPAFLLVAEYSGREPVVMDLQLYGCHSVGTTTDWRTGAEQVLTAFRAALTEQRAQAPGTAVRGGSLCQPRVSGNRSSVMPVKLADVTGGTVCGYADSDQTSGALRVERPLGEAELARITSDLEAHTSPWTPGECPERSLDQPATALALTTGWGDVLSVAPDECSPGYRYMVDGENLRWEPDADITTLLASLVR